MQKDKISSDFGAGEEEGGRREGERSLQFFPESFFSKDVFPNLEKKFLGLG